MTVRFEERYELLSRLGSGHRTDSFEARRRLTGERVVVKFLLEPLTGHSTETINNFVRELRAAGAVRHACLARILDAGVFEGHVFIVMEYVEGETLGARLRRHGRLEPGEARRAAGMAAGALAVIHGADLFHGNLTPENVMLRKSDGSVALTDYALDAAAVRAGAKIDLFRENGRPAADARDDIFALGALLFYCLTGESVIKPRAAGRGSEREHGPRATRGIDSMPAELESAAVFLMSHPDGDARDIFEQTADFLLHGHQPAGRANGGEEVRRRTIVPILVSLSACLLVLISAAAFLAPRWVSNKKQPPPHSRTVKPKNTAPVPPAMASGDNARASRIRRANWLYKQVGETRTADDKSAAARTENLVPALLGMAIEDAAKVAEQHQFKVEITESPSPPEQYGRVLAQTPEPGADAPPGGTLTLTVGTAPQDVLKNIDQEQ